MRRKNMRRGGSRARSRGIVLKFNEIYDISTEQGAPSIMAIHTPTGNLPYRMLAPAFNMYKRYKYCKADVTIVNGVRIMNPASAYTTETGQQTADPRDVLDPILFKGCHGEDLGVILNSIYSTQDNVFTRAGVDKKALNENLSTYYYASLTDPSWKKGNVNSTLRIPRLHPMCYRVASNVPIMNTRTLSGNVTDNQNWVNTVTGGPAAPSNSMINTGDIGSNSGFIPNLGYLPDTKNFTGTDTGTEVSAFRGQLFTNKLMNLGWLDTKLPGSPNESAQTSIFNGQIAQLPKIYMGVLMMPPAHKSFNYFRMIVTHTFAFSGLRTFSEGMVNNFSGNQVFGDIANAESGNFPAYYNEMENIGDVDGQSDVAGNILTDPGTDGPC